MVKNQKGGNKSKKMGRKFINAPVDRRVRLIEEEGELYAIVTKLLGNGMFNAKDTSNVERLCVMRNKFRGRGKRDNTVTLGTWVLIGEREFETTSIKPKCDLLEVYNDNEKNKLKNSGDPIFKNLKIDEFGGHGDSSCKDDIEFGMYNDDETDKYLALIEETNNNVSDDSNIIEKPIKNTIVLDNDDDDEIDVDDI
jgi:initiation factor 1A